MTEREKLALLIGNHVLDSLDKYLEHPMGRMLVVPAQVFRPRHKKEFQSMIQLSDWIVRINVDPPIVMKHIPLGGYESLDLKEFSREYKNITGEDPVWEIGV